MRGKTSLLRGRLGASIAIIVAQDRVKPTRGCPESLLGSCPSRLAQVVRHAFASKYSPAYEMVFLDSGDARGDSFVPTAPSSATMNCER
jgi:hypothetical protein